MHLFKTSKIPVLHTKYSETCNFRLFILCSWFIFSHWKPFFHLNDNSRVPNRRQGSTKFNTLLKKCPPNPGIPIEPFNSIPQKSGMEGQFIDTATCFDRMLYLRHEDGNILSAALSTYRPLHSSSNPPPPSISDLGEYSNKVRRTHFPFCFGWKTLRASILKICQKLFLPTHTHNSAKV